MTGTVQRKTDSASQIILQWGGEKGERKDDGSGKGGQQGELGRGIERDWEKKTQKEREKGGERWREWGKRKWEGKGKTTERKEERNREMKREIELY